MEVDGKTVALGNRKLLEQLEIDAGGLANTAEGMRGDGQTVLFVAVNGKIAGLLGVADPVKKTTEEAIRLFRDDGIESIMLTGDNRTTAQAVAKKLGIEKVEADVLPEKKNEVVERLRDEGRTVAMGTDMDVAMEIAGVTLVKSDLRGIAKARLLGRATMRNIRPNLFFAFIYNVLGVPIAARVLYPFIGLLLNPMTAAAATSFSSVIINALRLRKLSL